MKIATSIVIIDCKWKYEHKTLYKLIEEKISKLDKIFPEDLNHVLFDPAIAIFLKATHQYILHHFIFIYEERHSNNLNWTWLPSECDKGLTLKLSA